MLCSRQTDGAVSPPSAWVSMWIISSVLWVFPFMSIPPWLLRNTQIESGATIGGHARIPGYIRSDNGPEFIAAKVQQWLSENQIKTIYIDPGSPWQNGYIESFHSRFRDECLGREMFLNLREARVVISDWRLHYNQERPHSKLGYRSPNEFINTKTLTSLYLEIGCFFTDTTLILEVLWGRSFSS